MLANQSYFNSCFFIYHKLVGEAVAVDGTPFVCAQTPVLISTGEYAAMRAAAAGTLTFQEHDVGDTLRDISDAHNVLLDAYCNNNSNNNNNNDTIVDVTRTPNPLRSHSRRVSLQGDGSANRNYVLPVVSNITTPHLERTPRQRQLFRTSFDETDWLAINSADNAATAPNTVRNDNINNNTNGSNVIAEVAALVTTVTVD